jgi:hypothetical protein
MKIRVSWKTGIPLLAKYLYFEARLCNMELITRKQQIHLMRQDKHYSDN